MMVIRWDIMGCSLHWYRLRFTPNPRHRLTWFESWRLVWRRLLWW